MCLCGLCLPRVLNIIAITCYISQANPSLAAGQPQKQLHSDADPDAWWWWAAGDTQLSTCPDSGTWEEEALAADLARQAATAWAAAAAPATPAPAAPQTPAPTPTTDGRPNSMTDKNQYARYIRRCSAKKFQAIGPR